VLERAVTKKTHQQALKAQQEERREPQAKLNKWGKVVAPWHI